MPVVHCDKTTCKHNENKTCTRQKVFLVRQMCSCALDYGYLDLMRHKTQKLAGNKGTHRRKV